MLKIKKQNLPITIFWILTAFFIFIILSIFLEFLMGKIFVPMIFILLILAIILVIVTKKQKLKKQLKKHLLLTGYSIIAMMVSIFLHNFFYALAILSENMIFIKYIMEGLHVIFFFISIPIAPIVFIYGLVRVIILLVKK